MSYVIHNAAGPGWPIWGTAALSQRRLLARLCWPQLRTATCPLLLPSQAVEEIILLQMIRELGIKNRDGFLWQQPGFCLPGGFQQCWLSTLDPHWGLWCNWHPFYILCKSSKAKHGRGRMSKYTLWSLNLSVRRVCTTLKAANHEHHCNIRFTDICDNILPMHHFLL